MRPAVVSPRERRRRPALSSSSSGERRPATLALSSAPSRTGPGDGTGERGGETIDKGEGEMRGLGGGRDGFEGRISETDRRAPEFSNLHLAPFPPQLL